MPETKMTDEQYLDTQRRLLRHLYELTQLDLDALLARLAEAEGRDPDLDPTAYRRGAAALAGIQRLAGAARTLRLILDAERDELVGALADAFVSGAREAEGTRQVAGPGDPCAGGSVLS